MKPITVWYRFNTDRQRWEHNHYEEGQCGIDAKHPQPRSEAQEAWRGMKWLWRRKSITADKRIVDA